MGKVTYLLGAGASYNRVPIVSQTRNAFCRFYINQVVAWVYGEGNPAIKGQFNAFVFDLLQTHACAEKLDRITKKLCMLTETSFVDTKKGKYSDLIDYVQKNSSVKIEVDEDRIESGRLILIAVSALKRPSTQPAFILQFLYEFIVCRASFNLGGSQRHKNALCIIIEELLDTKNNGLDINKIKDHVLQYQTNREYHNGGGWYLFAFETMEYLIDELPNHDTIDQLCKYLYDKKSTEKLKGIKIFYTLMFLQIQEQHYFNKIDDLVDFSHSDYRYKAFLESPKFIHNEVKILSWNYDNQIELSCVQAKNIEVAISNKENPENNYRLFKLNGSMSLNQQDHDTYTNDGVYHIEELLIRRYQDFSSGKEPLIEFSFEKEKNEQFIDSVIDSIQETETMVVIGYSFPEDNNVTDKRILTSLPKLKKVFIQDIAETPRTNLEELLGQKCPEIVCINDVDEFHIPE